MGSLRPVTWGWDWWSRLLVQQKVWAILWLAFVPLIAALSIHIILVIHLLSAQQDRHRIVQALEQTKLLRRMVVDIEDASFDYFLTRQAGFLTPLREVEGKLKPAVDKALGLVEPMPKLATDLRGTTARVKALLDDQLGLIQHDQASHDNVLLRYMRSGQGHVRAETLRHDFRAIEDRLGEERERLVGNEEMLAHWAFWGLSLAMGGTLILGLLGGRFLSRSLIDPLSLLQRSVVKLGTDAGRGNPVPEAGRIAIHSSDEIGQLARSYEDMAARIDRQMRELEAINAVGHEINTLGPDGLDGVLRRITNRAADLLQVDVCLVMLRQEQMGCWIVEAASGGWNDRLHKSVMLWEEFPVSVRAFETKAPAIGEDLRKDLRPEVVRRNLIGESMLSLPLLSQGASFGVMVLLQERRVSADGWNVPLAKGFANEAAIAIANARLYDALYRKEKGLESRLRQLEHLAETLAHDLKGPGERMEGLASLLLAEYGRRLDDRGSRWLRMMEKNGRDLIERVHDILEVSRVGARPEAVEAVDPSVMIQDVLKARAGEIERGRVRVEVDDRLPLVACHRAYFNQIFDNLISNAVKFSVERADPVVCIEARRKDDRILFSVSDNGPGIPSRQRDRVFEPFVRLNPNVAKGSGIGLSIVRRIVELYGGRTWIEPNEPAGCRVCFSLPALGDLISGCDSSGGAETTSAAGQPGPPTSPGSESRDPDGDHHDKSYG